MEKPFQARLSKDGLSASLVWRAKEAKDFSEEEIRHFLLEENVVYGIKQDAVETILKNSLSFGEAILITEGKRSLPGTDAYLRKEWLQSQHAGTGQFDFRNILTIPSIKKGQLLATAIPPGNGTEGMTVSGKPIPARKGKQLKIKPGNHVLVNGSSLYAAIDGLVSITHNSVSVNPIYEVDGNLDLRTGNLNFPGSIVIRGNVPGGYVLKAGGDIIIFGMAEGSTVKAVGNIHVAGGIAGGNKGSYASGGNIRAAYLNQAEVIASGDVMIDSYILNSRVMAGGSINCPDGKAVGGILTSGRNILCKDLGNRLYAKTEVAIGWDPLLEKQRKVLYKERQEAKESLVKIDIIEAKLLEAVHQAMRMTDEKARLLSKQRATRQQLEGHIRLIENQLEEINVEQKENMKSILSVRGTMYPNTKVYFGRYSYKVNQLFSSVQFHLDKSEIIIKPIQIFPG
ncbi:FapA family protein [Mesobacillus foraminis]|uniref:FapA family protein n=1 Tax=Mesobacillus foraminis TaxID=279826 RepID=UPI000EF4C8E4|nr:FapA family protein [Mesobacillus foraminis]